jgi:selenocysteine-specific elongation factor
VIIGTAGHIDHGKTALVKALTGVDTDRLPEEKRRGITIDLGFAPLPLPGIGVAGVVDVPGHEAFVRTMLAGATGIDLALLIVAADEGAMPQTREHLAILSLLGITRGVVALTKADLVDPEWLALVITDLGPLLDGTPLAGAPIIPTSVISGEGLDALRDALAAAAREIPARDRDDLFRLPIDRVFTVKGTGTVVTGTVWSGSLERDGLVRILPGDRTARVRGMHAHGAPIEVALPGTRTAIALAGIDHNDIARGDVLVAHPSWRETRVIRVDVALLAAAGAVLSPRTRVRFHLGTADVSARVVTAGGPLAPGVLKPARVVLDAPVVARAGDRFVIRGGSPLSTIGGGVVADPLPQLRRIRPWSQPHSHPADRLALMLAEEGVAGVDVELLPVRLGLSPGAVRQLLDERLWSLETFNATGTTLVQEVQKHHDSRPLEPGAALQSIRGTLSGPADLVDEVVARAVTQGTLVIEGGMVRLAGWVPRLSSADASVKARLVGELQEAGAEPPSVSELVARFGTTVPALLRILEKEGVVVQVEGDRFYANEVVQRLVKTLRGGMGSDREYSPAELREVLGISRKYLIPFLEFCDRRGITDRRTTGRVLQGKQFDL